MKIVTILSFAAVLFNMSCNKSSIVVNGETTAFIDGLNRSTNSTPFESELENPIVTGTVTVDGSLESQSPDGSYCCQRILLTGPGNLLSSNFVKIIGNGELLGRSGNWAYNYESTSISLPSDHSPIELSLQIGNNIVLKSTVKLSNDVIVLPVYVHIFNGIGYPGDQYGITEGHIASMFDPPNFTTFGVAVNNPNRTRVTVKRYTILSAENVEYSKFELVDTIFKQAKIQFKLIRVTHDRNDSLSRQIFDSNGRGVAYNIIRRYHDRYKLERGIHIYFGGNSGGISGIIGRTLDRPVREQLPSNADDNLILISWGADRYIVAHEIGHFLGLDHVNGSFNEDCRSDAPLNDRSYGGQLLGEGRSVNENLMNICASGYQLTPGQISRLRSIACQYLSLWGLPNTACSP